MNECVFYKNKTMNALYADNSILARPDLKEIDTIIEDLREAKLEITKEGDLEDFLGIRLNEWRTVPSI
jgi:hypothetical protein